VTESDQPMTPFVASVLEANTSLTASITSTAVDALQYENKKLKATLYLIRERIDELGHEPMTPMLGQVLLRALEPDDIDISDYINKYLEP